MKFVNNSFFNASVAAAARSLLKNVTSVSDVYNETLNKV